MIRPPSRPWRLLEAVLDVLYPPRCAACDGPRAAGEKPLCDPCAATLCRHEASKLPGAESSPLAARHSAFLHGGAVAEVVARFKYDGRVDLARAVDWLLVHPPPQPDGPAPDAIVPVPLHRRRLRRRGFNQALPLARALSAVVGAPVKPGLLLRTRDTPPQVGLTRDERRSNVRDAFEARSAVPPRVWIVDDVITTGATIESCADALRDAGAIEVTAITLTIAT